MNLVVADKVSKVFRRHSTTRLIREHVTGWFKPADETHRFYALRDVSFTVAKGESVGVVGHNGAGKSTLLSLLTGLAPPDSGSLTVNGRVAALLDLGAGFHGDLTGAENVHLNAALLGFSRKRTYEMFDSIVDFSGLAEVIHEPLRTYSSGMVMRLAFSIAVNVDPDLLLVDEILAVGDQAFQMKCLDRIRAMRASGITLICVSHMPKMLTEFCDRGLWLDHGELVMNDSIGAVMEAYAGGEPAVRRTR